MKNYLAVLENCSLFDGISREDIPGMLDCLSAVVKKCSKNQQILAEGDDAVFVGVMLSGSAHIVKQDFYGNRSIVARIEPAELFGESFACAGVPELPVSVIANEDSEIMLIPCQRITVGCSNACAFHSRMIFNLLRAVATRNLEFHQKLEITTKRTTREKLMAYLLAQAKAKGSDTFTIPYDRQGLADYLGVERSAMSAELGKLRKDGIIDCRRSHFTLL